MTRSVHDENRAADKHVEHFEPLDPTLANVYWERSDRLRAEHPVVWSDGHWSEHNTGFWLLNRYDDVFAAAADWERYSNADGACPVQFDVDVLRMIPLEVDPPMHRNIRRLLNPFFTVEALKATEPDVRRIVDELLDECVVQGEVDFVSSFCSPLPSQVFFGLFFREAKEDKDKIAWVLDILLQLFSHPEKAMELAPHLFIWCAELLESRAAEGIKDDLVGVIAHAGVEGDTFSLSDRERIETLNMVIMAGMETTASAVGNVAYHLATDEDLRARLRTATPEQVDRAVDEFLRHDPPVPLAGRTLTEDTELRGCPMRKGDRIMLNWAGASRDPEMFPDAEVLDITRPNAAKHQSFGAGIHRCLGNHLARRELANAVRAICDLTTFELVEGAEVNWRPAFARGPFDLPVRIAR